MNSDNQNPEETSTGYVTNKGVSQKVISLLADFLGVEVSDIVEEDSLTDDLHMTAANLSDFSHLLSENGYDSSLIDYNEIDSVGSILEILSNENE